MNNTEFYDNYDSEYFCIKRTADDGKFEVTFSDDYDDELAEILNIWNPNLLFFELLMDEDLDDDEDEEHDYINDSFINHEHCVLLDAEEVKELLDIEKKVIARHERIKSFKNHSLEVLAMPVIITKQLTLQNAVQILRLKDEEFAEEIKDCLNIFLADVSEEGYARQNATYSSKYGEINISSPDQARTSIWIGFNPSIFYEN